MRVRGFRVAPSQHQNYFWLLLLTTVTKTTKVPPWHLYASWQNLLSLSLLFHFWYPFVNIGWKKFNASLHAKSAAVQTQIIDVRLRPFGLAVAVMIFLSLSVFLFDETLSFFIGFSVKTGYTGNFWSISPIWRWKSGPHNPSGLSQSNVLRLQRILLFSLFPKKIELHHSYIVCRRTAHSFHCTVKNLLCFISSKISSSSGFTLWLSATSRKRLWSYKEVHSAWRFALQFHGLRFRTLVRMEMITCFCVFHGILPSNQRNPSLFHGFFRIKCH